jgi:transposase InsO family protein
MLEQRLSLSERRACRITGQHRSTQRHRPKRARDRDDSLRERLRSLSRTHPRWGYRRAWAFLRAEGHELNRKKIQRLWREEGLRVPPKRRKRLRIGTSTSAATRLRAERPNHVWALDFQFDVTSDGRTFKCLHVVDEHTREALAIRVERGIDADQTVSVLERIVSSCNRSPELLRMDNGPELTANALRDWCRFAHMGTSYIEPGSPWENPFVESFASRFRDEVLSVEELVSLREAKLVSEEWRHIYNHLRPHSSLGWRTPAAYAAEWSD